MRERTANKINKSLSIVANTLVYVFCAICLVLFLFTVFSKRDTDGAVKLFGYEMRVVLSGSMEKHPDVNVADYKIKDIKTGSMVFVRLVPDNVTKAQEFYSKLKVGDVLTFRYDVSKQQISVRHSPQMTITHRIIDIQPSDNGGYIITLRGDNQSATGLTDVQIIDTSAEESPNYVVGKVTAKSFLFGWLAYSLKRPLGLAMLIITPCAIIIVWNVVRIVNLLKNGKRQSEKLN